MKFTLLSLHTRCKTLIKHSKKKKILLSAQNEGELLDILLCKFVTLLDYQLNLPFYLLQLSGLHNNRKNLFPTSDSTVFAEGTRRKKLRFLTTLMVASLF